MGYQAVLKPVPSQCLHSKLAVMVVVVVAVEVGK
jgi:hypothetical protein